MKRILFSFVWLLAATGLGSGVSDNYGGDIFNPGSQVVQSTESANSKIVGPSDNLQNSYNWLASSSRNARMGALSAENPRYLIRTPGQYTGDITDYVDYVYVVDMTPGTVTDTGHVVSAPMATNDVRFVEDKNLIAKAAGPVVGVWTDPTTKAQTLLYHFRAGASPAGQKERIVTYDGATFTTSTYEICDTAQSVYWVRQVSTDATGPTGANSKLLALCTTTTSKQCELFSASTPLGEWTSEGTFPGCNAALSGGHHYCDLGDGQALMLSYSSAGDASYIWYSTDGFDSWGNNAAAYDDTDPLMTTTANSIAHFHGAIWNSTYSKLYVMTGDSTSGARGVLVCDDFADFIANPETETTGWKTLWALDQVGYTNRAAVLNTSTNVIQYGTNADGAGWNDTALRTVSICFDSNNRYGFWIDDSFGGEVMMIDAADATNKAQKIDTVATSEGFYSLRTSNGVVLFSQISRYNSGTGYKNGSDDYTKIYSVNPAGATLIYAPIRHDADFLSVASSSYLSSKGPLYIRGLFECWGRVWIPTTETAGPYFDKTNQTWSVCGQVNNQGISSITTAYRPVASTVNYYSNQPKRDNNFIKDSEFAISTEQWTANVSATLSIDSSVVATGCTGKSLKIVPAKNKASSGAIAYISAAKVGWPAGTGYLRDRWVTFTCWIKMPSAAINNNDTGQLVNISIVLVNGTVPTVTWTPFTSEYDSGWHKVKISQFVSGAAGVEAYPYVFVKAEVSAYDSDDLEPIYICDPCVTEGTIGAPANTRTTVVW